MPRRWRSGKWSSTRSPSPARSCWRRSTPVSRSCRRTSTTRAGGLSTGSSKMCGKSTSAAGRSYPAANGQVAAISPTVHRDGSPAKARELKFPVPRTDPSRPAFAMPPRAAYLHVPFCRHRCGYCNFTVIAGREDLQETFLEALARELQAIDPPREVDTLFIGGGTPTHLDLPHLDRLLALVRQVFPPADGYE